MRSWLLAALLVSSAYAQVVRGSSADLRGPGSQIKVRNSNSNVGGYIFSNSDNQILVMGGVEWDGSNFVARATSASILKLSLGGFTFYGNTGLTPGTPYAPTQLATSVGFQYDVRTYGAVCDGVTDDTAAVQAAINAVGINRGVIVLPNGVCKVSTVTMTSSFQGIRGQGRDVSILYSTTNAPIIDIPTVAVSGQFNAMDFNDFTVKGNGGTSQVGIRAIGTGLIDYTTIRNMTFDNVYKGIYIAPSIQSSFVHIQDNLFVGPFTCIDRNTPGTGWIISGNSATVLAGGTCIYIHGSSGVGDIIVNSNHIEGGAVGIDFYCDTTCTYGSRVVANDNKIDTVSTAAIRAFNVTGSTFLGNRVMGGVSPVTFTGTSTSNIYDANDGKGIYFSGSGGVNDNISINGIGTMGSIRLGATDEAVHNTNVGIGIKDGSANSAIGVGQSQARSVGLTWTYNATPANGFGQLATFGFANEIRYGASLHRVLQGDWSVETNLLQPLNTPASASAACTATTIKWDANYIYVCTATNTWKRVAINTW